MPPSIIAPTDPPSALRSTVKPAHELHHSSEVKAGSSSFSNASFTVYCAPSSTSSALYRDTSVSAKLPHAQPQHNPFSESARSKTIPTVRLDVENVSDVVAARLATALLGHVLFLKSQIPLPVAQLARMKPAASEPSATRGPKTNSRAVKHRMELLSSYDTLSSHLATTFTALSSALARCAQPSLLPPLNIQPSPSRSQEVSSVSSPVSSPLSKALGTNSSPNPPRSQSKENINPSPRHSPSSSSSPPYNKSSLALSGLPLSSISISTPTSTTSKSTFMSTLSSSSVTTPSTSLYTASPEATHYGNGSGSGSGVKIARVYLAILVGPSLTSARAKVIMGVDGFECKVWGERDDDPLGVGDDGDKSEEEDDDDDESGSESESESERGSGSTEDGDSEETEESGIGSDEEADEETSDAESVPESEGHHSVDEPECEGDDEARIQAPSEPPKPSTNHCVAEKAHILTQPAVPSLLAAASPLSTHPQSISSNPLGSDISPRLGGAQQHQHHHQQQRLHQIQYRTSPPSSTPPSSRPSHAEEQQMLHNAERTLAKTLALADAESESGGLACEMAPTQTHILILAPRRFVHPAWVPKQNMKSTMDGVLERFLEESFPVPPPSLSSSSASLGGLDDQKNRVNGSRNGNKAKDKGKVEGVWVVPNKNEGTREFGWGRDHHHDEGGGRREEEEEEEEDEMIWWSWDGKLVGFSDW
ncbi:hypothetical protein BDN72DRAFT_847629 [Pluteus cervinus]|uniref:Uncharacterized protein n=1 Tax=Pluteus cervinus TaxID=181527 RepID=A0ACD3AC11_9AGAR|nr:hypothetical protein BDN72DRAFT_847629 [Pluteus cervinus]